MKTTVSLGLIFAAAFACAGPVPQEWKARYAGVLKVIEAKNLPGFHAMFAKDFVTVDDKGKSMTRAAFLKEVDGMFASATRIDGVIKLNDAMVRGDMVDVKFDFTMTLHHKGKGTTKVHEVGVDTWKKV